jgi:hypothetical protein
MFSEGGSARTFKRTTKILPRNENSRLASRVPLLTIAQDPELARLARQIDAARLKNDLKTEVALRLKSAERQKNIILEEEKKAIDFSGARGAALMGSVTDSVEELHYFWKVTQELYERQKERPPYWFASYWKSEMETVIHQTAWWEARGNYYRAKHAELLAYAALEDGLDVPTNSTLDTNAIPNSSWDKVIQPALEAAGFWKKSFDSCRAGLGKTQEGFRKEWDEALQEIIDRETLWFQHLSWYAEQGGRSKDPALQGMEADRPYLYAPPAEPWAVSAYELEQYGNDAQLLSHKEFSSPHEKRKVCVRVLKTSDNETPYIRLEEIIDIKLGVVGRNEMMANDFLIKLPEGVDLETTKGELVSLYNALTRKHPSRPGLSLVDLNLKRITSNMSFYRLHFSTVDEKKLEDVWEGLFDTARVKRLQPEPSSFLEYCNAIHPNDDEYGEQWNLNGSRGIHAPEAWYLLGEQGRDISQIRVAIIDGGTDSKHPDLEPNISPEL